jgi:hypothetical protein
MTYLALDAAEGTNLEEVREGMGHSDSRVTRAYARRYQWEVRRKVIDRLPNPEDPLATTLATAMLLAVALLFGGPL